MRHCYPRDRRGPRLLAALRLRSPSGGALGVLTKPSTAVERQKKLMPDVPIGIDVRQRHAQAAKRKGKSAKGNAARNSRASAVSRQWCSSIADISACSCFCDRRPARFDRPEAEARTAGKETLAKTIAGITARRPSGTATRCRGGRSCCRCGMTLRCSRRA